MAGRRRGPRRARLPRAGHPATVGPRVASSPVALLVLAGFWLLLPSGFAVASWTDPSAGGDWVFQSLAVLGWMLWWRLARRSCVRLADGTGLLVRGVLRRDVVRWGDLLGVDWAESEPAANGFTFSHTIVVFEVPPGSGPRFAVVAASGRSGSAYAHRILNWLPAGHPLRAELPTAAGLAAGRSGPDQAARACVRAAPVTAVLRPQPVQMLLMLACEAAVVAMIVAATVSALDPDDGVGGARPWVAVGGCLLTILGLGGMIRTIRSRVHLTPLGLVDRGVLRTVAYATREIDGFRADPSGLVEIVRVVLIGRGSRQLAAGCGFNRYPAAVLGELTAWLHEARSS